MSAMQSSDTTVCTVETVRMKGKKGIKPESNCIKLEKYVTISIYLLIEFSNNVITYISASFLCKFSALYETTGVIKSSVMFLFCFVLSWVFDSLFDVQQMFVFICCRLNSLFCLCCTRIETALVAAAVCNDTFVCHKKAYAINH